MDDMRKKKFELVVQEIFCISGRGVSVCGEVLSGAIRVGDEVVIVKESGRRIPTRVELIEGFRKTYQEAVVGDNIGLLFKNLDKMDVNKGEKLKFEWQ